MSERKETFWPGPWKYDPRTNEILNDNRYPIAEYVLELENGNLIAAAPEMYKALKMVCEDCEKLSNWEDMFNIGRPEGSIMPKCPCDECYVKEALKKARGEENE